MAPQVSASHKFRSAMTVKSTGLPLNIRGSIPGEYTNKGDSANVTVIYRDASNEQRITLVKKLAEGGEGSVFTTSKRGFVAKVYKRERLTTARRDKLQIMIGKQINCPGVCFPVACIYNERNEFVGYLMPEAKGFELGKSVFQPQLLLKRFPNWTKQDTIQLALTILRKIKYLNDRNVILGDINPANILVKSPKEVYFVDCDSYQIEGYPCPVGTVNYTPPEAQGKDYKTFLRTQQMENFAIATLLFMIMLPGKAPYAAVGGDSQAQNIIRGDFPYPLTEDTDKTPPGKWGFIWSHLSWKMKEAFYQTFKRGECHFAPDKRRDAGQWIQVFESYLNSLSNLIKNDPMANDIFPTRKKGDYVVERRTCKS